MKSATITDEMTFIMNHRGLDEATIVAQAFRYGMDKIYKDSLIEAYLSGKISRKKILSKIGPEEFGKIEYQKEVLKNDVEWGFSK